VASGDNASSQEERDQKKLLSVLESLNMDGDDISEFILRKNWKTDTIADDLKTLLGRSFLPSEPTFLPSEPSFLLDPPSGSYVPGP
jgi:hypothetical protein